jgi:eukaryotic-like serine/threonine-protein kinase
MKRQTPVATGGHIGPYVLEEKLGEGGMGVVFRATDTRLRRAVALKILDDNFAADRERRRRFLREARLAAAVTHPNIAAIYEVGETDGRLFLVQELVAGTTLRQRLAGSALPLPEQARIARALASALARAHERGVIHRDLKPENIAIDADGEVKILDFGLAKRTDERGADASSSLPLSDEGEMLGTPGYMSPEQVNGLTVDHRTDLFALGVILYEMATGTRPFRGTGMVAVAAVVHDQPIAPRSLVPDLSPSLERLMMQCLEKQPAARPASARDILDELDRMEGRAPQTTPAPSAPPAARAVLSVVPTTMRRRPRRPRWTWAVLGGVIAATGVAAWLMTRARPHRSPPPEAQRPVFVTDHVLPTWASPQAVSAYRAGLQLSRDAAQSAALERFREVIAADARLPQPHLQMAAIYSVLGAGAAREHLAKASTLRDAFSERDRAAFDAIYPAVYGDRVNFADSARRLRQVLERRPNDVQLHFLVSDFLFTAGELEEAVSSARRAVELDPKYGMGFADLGYELAYLGKRDQALDAFRRCEEVSPTPHECWSYRSEVYAEEGRCAEIEADAQKWIATAPTMPDGYRLLVDVYPSLGRPLPAAREALRQAIARTPEGERSSIQETYEARLAAISGDFAAAESHARILAGSGSSAEIDHAIAAELLVDTLRETGRLPQAAEAASDFVSRRGVWTPDLRADDLAMSKDPTARFLALEARAGRRTRESFATALRDHVAQWKQRTGPFYVRYLWLHAYAAPAETVEEARAAVEAMAQFSPLPTFRPETLAAADVGRTLLLAGRTAEAVGELERATAHCFAARHPFAAVRARLDLGRAREGTGDRAGACRAYAEVLARWGSARPRSLTADEARRRTRALGCAAPAAP